MHARVTMTHISNARTIGTIRTVHHAGLTSMRVHTRIYRKTNTTGKGSGALCGVRGPINISIYVYIYITVTLQIFFFLSFPPLFVHTTSTMGYSG